MVSSCLSGHLVQADDTIRCTLQYCRLHANQKLSENTCEIHRLNFERPNFEQLNLERPNFEWLYFENDATCHDWTKNRTELRRLHELFSYIKLEAGHPGPAPLPI